MSATCAIAGEATGAIEGKVTEASSHTALQGIEVCAYSTNELLSEEEAEHAYGCAQTGTDGDYTITELRPESYFVVFGQSLTSKLNYITQFYDDKLLPSEATAVQVVAGKTAPGIDSELSPGAEIAGGVTEASTGAPIGNAIACASRANPEELGVGGCAITEANGEYTIRGLASGSYKLVFLAMGSAAQYYSGKSSAAEAELVSVVAPGLTQGIDAAMKPRGPLISPPGSTPSEAAPTSKLPGGLTAPSSSSPDATLSLARTRIAVARNGNALVKVDCAGTATCRAKLTLKMKRLVTVKGKKTLRTVTLGTSAALSITAGKTATAQIRLDAAGRRMLSADHGRLALELALATPGHKQDLSVVLIEQRTQGKR
jgi:hypothetical protein